MLYLDNTKYPKGLRQMEKTLDELRQEATDLGIEFAANLGAAKLAAKIEDYYKSQETSIVDVPAEKVNSKGKSMRERIIDAKAAANVTHVVTITDNDQRENNHTTTVRVNCVNSYFDLGPVILPLNTPVEVKQGYIDVLKEIQIPLHIQGSDGITRWVMRSRYSIQNQDELK